MSQEEGLAVGSPPSTWGSPCKSRGSDDEELGWGCGALLSCHPDHLLPTLPPVRGGEGEVR